MFRRVLVIFCLLLSLFLSSSAQTCEIYDFSSNKVFSSCYNLPCQNSFLHWNYNSSSGSLQIAFRHLMLTSRWAAWAINPNGLQTAMIGAQAVVAYQLTNGTMRAYTSQIKSYATTMPEGNLIYNVSDLTATYANNEIIVYATLGLPSDTTTINQVWQEGPVTNDSPGAHSFENDNTISFGTLNLLSRQYARAAKFEASSKNLHGMANTLSWGIVMPVGVMIARYAKVFKFEDPAWFKIHVICQSSAYVVGVAGWATGMKLGSDSTWVEYRGHRILGILIFILGTFQVFALVLRPKKDHKYRFHWKICHYSIGYLVILLAIINIFKGYDILKPQKTYKNAYIGFIVALAVSAVWLEAFTWYVFLKRSESAAKKPQG
ncbi:hypothetical protein FH972_000086 [Carpinus fangiana]|uniref:Cytochrome b561 and DOMON domain-containing protein n=1 Tax=Carpinus fangiana TaxID=176857 RepID=A0A5N6Q7P5_9ROSI|nr:hypothetical protein FH972_000086 [Carpinus fangiana]